MKIDPELLVNKLTILIAVVFVVVGFCAVLFFADMRKNSPQFVNKPFDSTSWRNAADTCTMGDYTRIQMVDDLQNHYHLVGMSRREVERLLGPPTKQEPNRYAYCLGPQRSVIVSGSDWLTLDISNDVVTGARVGSN
jgi:hypothetical protein